MINILPIRQKHLLRIQQVTQTLSLDPNLALLLVCASINNVQMILQANPAFNMPGSFKGVKVCTPYYLLTSLIAHANCIDSQDLDRLRPYPQRIQKWIDERESRMVCSIDVRVLMAVNRNPDFAYQLNNRLDLLLPSGTPIMWLLGIHECAKELDLLTYVVNHCARKGKKVLLLGDQTNILDLVAKKIKTLYPEMQPCLQYCLEDSRYLLEEEVREINEHLQPDVILLSLPHPLQEDWLIHHYQALQTTVIGVSDAFQLYIGAIPQSPQLLQNLGLEWLIHLIANPRRLWSPYIHAVPAFLCLLLYQHFANREFSCKQPVISEHPTVNQLLEQIRRSIASSNHSIAQ
ncbi:MAG: WecB/TagA/CpsF family glycosyltransferase [Spirulina sp. SIO3F2]|nr:WecB/TagA/CpsF family glycosyltransferase [Spirulina sp. SIO3F2]